MFGANLNDFLCGWLLSVVDLSMSNEHVSGLVDFLFPWVLVCMFPFIFLVCCAHFKDRF